MRTRERRQGSAVYRTAAVAAAVVLGLTGCGSGDDADHVDHAAAGGRHSTPPAAGSSTSAGTKGPSTGPGTAADARPPSSAPHSAKPSLAKPSPAAPSARDGSDVGACFDGTCEIRVSKPRSIPLDGRYGVSRMNVGTIGPSTVTVDASGPGISLGVTVSRGGTGQLNAIRVRVRYLRGGTAVLALSPAR